MKIIHQNGYTVEELSLCRSTVYKNLVDCSKSLIGGLQQFDIKPSASKVQSYIDFLLDYTIDPDPNVLIDSKVGDAVTYLWNDPCIPAVMAHSNEFYLMDSAP